MFVINNNSLVLVGSDSVWMFDFGNKMLVCNPYEMHLKEENTLLMTENQLMKNLLSMTLYAFGKWGKIKGLTVEKEYSDLNDLFSSFLNEIQVEPVLTADSLRFYKNEVQITYEEVIQSVLDKKLQEEAEKDDKDNENEYESKIYNSKYNKGLWHKIIWKSEHETFSKEKINESEKLKARMGNNFYMVSYKCPDCGEKLYMVVYPEGKEYLIETDEKGVYLARAYTCNLCHRMYTPKPQMLLLDGDMFCIDFEDDSVAYSDYLEVIGKQGIRTSNKNFNEYEVNYNRENIKREEKLEDICNELNSMNNQELFELQDKMDSGFYSKKSTDIFQKVVDSEVKSRQKKSNNKGIEKDAIQEEKINEDRSTLKAKESTNIKVNPEVEINPKIEINTKAKANLKTEVNLKIEKTPKIEGTSKNVTLVSDEVNSGYKKRIENDQNIDDSDSRWSERIEEEKEEEEEDDSKGLITTTNPALKESIFDIKSDHLLGHKDNARLESDLSYEKEKELVLKAVQCKDKNYTNILRVINEIKDENISKSSKDSILHSLQELLNKRGKAELDAICFNIPENITKSQYIQYTKMIEQYEGIDNTTSKKHLDYMRDEVEKREIAAYINIVKAKDSKALAILYNKLKKENFEERNVVPFLEKINEKIKSFDEGIIRKICQDPATLTFETGLKAYEEISTKDLLPELKVNILNEIDNRLRKIKMNECEQLVEKLSKEIGNQVKNYSRIHFYDVRKGMRDSSEDEETQVMKNAQNIYAARKGRYEFPILVCDTSVKRDGGKGFILTPDHIFYYSMVDLGLIDINKIKAIKVIKGIFSSKLSATTFNDSKIKISNSLGLSNLKAFAKGLNDFIGYLKEKPESRDISYMAEEKHKIICCYRCGFNYRDESACPKCGAKINE